MIETLEEWRPIAGFEGFYEVSDLGKIRSLDRVVDGRQLKGRMLKFSFDPGGYRAVVLYKNGSRLNKRVHVLVAAAFLGPRPEGLIVRHGSKGQLDNSPANLCYGTHADNEADKVRDGTHNRGERHYQAKLTEADIPEIRSLLAAGKSQKSIANTFGVSYRTIWVIRQGKAWAHVA